MNLLLFLKIFSQWEMILISGLIMVLIPLVSYISTLKKKTGRVTVAATGPQIIESPPEKLGE